MKKSYLKYISALFIFGSNGIVASYIHLNSYEIVFLRTLIASIFLLCVFLLSKRKLEVLENKMDFLYLVALGVTTGVSWIFLYQAYAEIGVSLATLIYYCGPIIIILLSPFVFKESLNIYKILGSVVIFIGMILTNGNQCSNAGLSFGLVCGIFAALTYSILIIFAKQVKVVSGIEYTLIQLISCLITVGIYLTIKQGPYIPNLMQNIFPVLFLGIVNTGIGCCLYFSAIKELSAGSVAICGYLEPLSALLFSALLLSERLSFIQIIGAICIIGGAIFAESYKYIKLSNYKSKDSYCEIDDSCELSSDKSVSK